MWMSHELVVRQPPAGKDMNMETEEYLLGAITGNIQWRHTRRRVCCSEKQSAWISENIVITCSYNL
jgi:hypothetical protein